MASRSDWSAAESAPRDYPVYIVTAFFTMPSGAIEGIPDDRIAYGGWGKPGSTQLMGEAGEKPAPRKLTAEWFDLVAGMGYKGTIELPSNRIDAALSRGLPALDKPKNVPVDFIVVGFAPGGYLAVWLQARGVSHLAGTFSVPQSEISVDRMANDPSLNLDQFADSMLSLSLKDRVAEIRARPDPSALYKRYAQRYSYNAVVTGPVPFDYLWLSFLDAERDWFDLTGRRPQATSAEGYSFAAPKSAEIGWSDAEGRKFGAEVAFDPDEVMNAFWKLASVAGDSQMTLEFEPAEKGGTVDAYLKAGDTFYRFERTTSQIYRR
ncbi:hypothetical protein A6F68_01272 [Tsuneonella dongtanensis]|uniref:DUF2931 family protein n=1 Tax=Tsuneonella dongtanensis TaxID=692370 RepID=A0A1B2ACA3_9SPHN|nr:DUF2931 family protein [Tsuneonella dongtanensis]ANY19789.1 hypothetical protein A6F68_01272 [Tsuneonella dongtanensis]